MTMGEAAGVVRDLRASSFRESASKPLRDPVSFVTGVAGRSKASIVTRLGDPVAAADHHRLIATDQPLAAGRDVVNAVADAARRAR